MMILTNRPFEMSKSVTVLPLALRPSRSGLSKDVQDVPVEVRCACGQRVKRLQSVGDAPGMHIGEHRTLRVYGDDGRKLRHIERACHFVIRIGSEDNAIVGWRVEAAAT